MNKEDQRDDLEMARETTDHEPSYIVVNGYKEWLVNYGLMEGELTWEEEELSNATTNNSSQANEETSNSSTDHSYSKHGLRWD